MGLRNPFTLHKISVKLARQAIRNWNNAFPENLVKINRTRLFLKPLSYIKEISRKNKQLL
jgi:hypothetical protein